MAMKPGSPLSNYLPADENNDKQLNGANMQQCKFCFGKLSINNQNNSLNFVESASRTIEMVFLQYCDGTLLNAASV